MRAAALRIHPCHGLAVLAALLVWSCAEGSSGRGGSGSSDGGEDGEAGSGVGAAGGGAATTSSTTTGAGGSAGPCGVVVNEVQVASSSGASDEFVELHNSCAASLDLTGWKLVYRSSDGTSDTPLYSFGSGSITGQGYLLIVGEQWSGGVAPDATFTFGGLAADGGGVGVRDPGDALVDSVGYGDATNDFVEHLAAPAPPGGSSIGRSPDGADIDNNATDFVLFGVPSPKGPNAP